MSELQLQAISFYLGGSWVYDSIYDMPDSNKERLLAEFIDCHGQDVLDETIAYIQRDHADPMPKWLANRSAKYYGRLADECDYLEVTKFRYDKIMDTWICVDTMNELHLCDYVVKVVDSTMEYVDIEESI